MRRLHWQRTSHRISRYSNLNSDHNQRPRQSRFRAPILPRPVRHSTKTTAPLNCSHALAKAKPKSQPNAHFYNATILLLLLLFYLLLLAAKSETIMNLTHIPLNQPTNLSPKLFSRQTVSLRLKLDPQKNILTFSNYRWSNSLQVFPLRRLPVEVGQDLRRWKLWQLQGRKETREFD